MTNPDARKRNGSRGSEPSARSRQQGSRNDTPSRDTAQEEPEHRSDRRRFLVWAVLAGYVKPERLTERILDEIEVAK